VEITISRCRRIWRHHSFPADSLSRTKSRFALFFKKAVAQHGLPGNITIDKSDANSAAIEALKEEAGEVIEIREMKYLNSLVERMV
jgi:putative transposase